jgi:hypothetical protein
MVHPEPRRTIGIVGVRKTVRARKARRRSTCPSCRSEIRVGELIAQVNGGSWKHADCGAAADRQAAAVAARYGRPVDVLRSL